MHEKTFFYRFWENETNICEMTKKGQKRSFHAGKVVAVAKIGIMEIVIAFTERKKENIVSQRKEIL